MPTKDYNLIRILSGNPIKDERRRKGDRHREGYERPNPVEYKKKPSKWERRSIVAWDGEGANTSDGTHIYNLLANSNGDYIINHKGLSTLEIFKFCIDHSREDDINVVFGGSYDVNMILKDVPREKLEELWTNGKTYWNRFRILWAPRKKFTIQYIIGSKVVKTFVLWDVIGYFQSSFVIAVKKWLGEIDVLDNIQQMKNKRSIFKAEDIDEIVEYNRKECVLLVMLMERLFASLDEAEVSLMRYDGAGSIAAALLKKFHVREYKGRIPAKVNRWAQYAYSGGRIEAVKSGTTTKIPTKVFRYDINSAYPSATLTLPSYRNATWEKQDKWDGTNNSLVCVRFHFVNEAPFYPLWYRNNNGNIIYPRQGYGVYWGAEVANLFKYYSEGDDFEIEWAINCTLGDDVKPFSFNTTLFELRKKFKSEGSMASESLKLGLNSEYGKLVQQAGYRDGRIPTYHQLLWGGQITAYTRAKLFDAAMQAPEHVISFATDAVFTTKELDLPCSGELGEWSFDTFGGITIVQAGVYFLYNIYENKWEEKFRGFDKGSLDREKIIQCWENGDDYEATLTRFVGLGSALMSSDFNIWRTWATEPRKLDIRPTGKRIAGKRQDYHRGLRVTKPAPNITPELMSEPYLVEWIDGKGKDSKEKIDQHILVIINEEEEDGYL